MTFNDNARIDTSKVQRRGGGVRRGAAIGGGSLLGVIGVALLSQLFGVNLGPLASLFLGEQLGGHQTSQEQVIPLDDQCATGAAANENDECRMAAASDSIDTYWQAQFSNGYRSPGVIIYSGTTQSACGTASNAVGPFYCPADESIYIDTTFFDMLHSDFGASAGPLAQMYVLAHEWGHHVSNITGQMPRDNRPGAASGAVRLELQADCYAGAWVKDASSVTDRSGVPFMKPVTKQEIADALNAAAAVGDDHIQRQAGQRVNPESFTHGSSEQRQRWFQTGYQLGPQSCDTFSVSAGQL